MTNNQPTAERPEVCSFADDEQSLQELMSLELPRMGHEVTVCPDGMTAVAALEKNTYDCIIVDLDMPGLSGIEVIGKARSCRPIPKRSCSPASRRSRRPSPRCGTARSIT